MNTNCPQDGSCAKGCPCNCLQFDNTSSTPCLPPSSVANALWSQIYNAILEKGSSTLVMGGTTYPTAKFKTPPYTFTAYTPTNCPWYKCEATYTVPSQSNPMCYDTQGKCNQYVNFSMLVGWIQEITGEYNCPLNSCNRGQGCCDITLSESQSDFLNLIANLTNTLTNIKDANSFLSLMNEAVANNDLSWAVSGGIIPGTTVIAKLNSYIEENNIIIPFIEKLP